MVNTLTGVGLNSTVSWVIVTLLGLIIGHFAVPQKWASILIYVEKIALGFYTFLHWLNLKTNKVSRTQKTERDLELRGRLKKTLTIIALLLIVGTASAQSRWSGFFEPVKKERLNTIQLKSSKDGIFETGAWLFRPSATLTAVAIDFSSGSVTSQSLSSVGLGVSYGKFSTVEEKAYCTYSFNALLLTSVKIGDEQSTSLGGAVTIDAFNKLVGFGVGYIDKSFMMLTTISYSF
jgi:hypothetical protein